MRLAAKRPNQGPRASLGGRTQGVSVGPGALADFVKVRTVGQGSFGEALLVKHRTSGQLCVLKRVRLEAAREATESAAREAQVLQRLKHPHIVELLGAFADNLRDSSGATLCLVMAYCEGGDLQQRLQRVKREGKQLSEQPLLRWFDQLSSAVYYVHQHQVLHRDLKPSNIFLTGKAVANGSGSHVIGKEESVAIGDFGVSRPLEHAMELVTTMVGTPCYLSPEVCRGKPYSYKSDIWSLGCVLFEMLALRPPFGTAPNLEALVTRIVRAEIQMPEQLVSEYPEASRCARAMLRKEADRRPTAHALLNRPRIISLSYELPGLTPSSSSQSSVPLSQAPSQVSQATIPPAQPQPPIRAGARSLSPPAQAFPRQSVGIVAAQAAVAAAAASVMVVRAEAFSPRAKQRASMANQILQAEARQKNVEQAFAECDPTKLGLHQVPSSSSHSGPSPTAVRQRSKGNAQVVKRMSSAGPSAGEVISHYTPSPSQNPHSEPGPAPSVQVATRADPRLIKLDVAGGRKGNSSTPALASAKVKPDSPEDVASRSPSSSTIASAQPQTSNVAGRGSKDVSRIQQPDDKSRNRQTFKDWLREQRSQQPGNTCASADNRTKVIPQEEHDIARPTSKADDEQTWRTEIYCPGFPVLRVEEKVSPRTVHREFQPPSRRTRSPSPKLFQKESVTGPSDIGGTPSEANPSDSSFQVKARIQEELSPQLTEGRSVDEHFVSGSSGSREGRVDDSKRSVSIGDRIEGIRACLEAKLGTQRFQKLYRSLVAGDGNLASPVQWPRDSSMVLPEDLDEAFNGAEDCGSEDVATLLPLVAKLVACEQSYFS